MIWRDERRDPACNMASDEALLCFAAKMQVPVLRFYGWTQPAATFGYFQRIADIESWTPLRPLIRRPTGGGLVPHDADWTYSAAFPPGSSWYSLRAEESYQQLHELIAESLVRIGIDARLSPCCVKEAPGQCFSGAEKFDVVGEQGKVAGAAQRRNKLGLLAQGSVQPVGVRASRSDWENALVSVIQTRLGAHCVEWTRPKEFDSHVARLVAEKYGADSYNRRR